ncbi:meiosis 1 arrest protein-like, partial [Actinia tenebrosa]|uniref:Meiosis 1 arrest protein-like n=1 Tax=Actinia tenebrosa TaxID=6105 RepID=A0A6P8HMF9_ACTTE
NLFQLQHVKNNFPRLHSALEELKFFTKDTKQQTESKTTEVLLQGMQDAITQFKRQSQSFRQINTSSCQMEICVFTCRKSSNVTRKIEEISSNLDLGSIKKIQIAAVVDNTEDQDVQEDYNNKEQETSPSSSTETGMTGCGIVDTIVLQKDPSSFQNFFKTWLIDCETDQEHLRIELPSPCALNEEDMILEPMHNNTVTLKCDLHERLISPSNLPYRSQFEVNAECVPVNKSWACNTKQNGVNSYPVHTMAVDRLIKREAICESVIFGMPYILRPTVCWKLDWEELERNQQYCHALCHALQERDLMVLLKTKTDTKQGQQPSLPIGHFILLPSHGNTMLLKSIATNELMLPVDLNQPVEGPNIEATEIIGACLDQLHIVDAYNPLLVRSNLYKCLSSNALKGNKGNVPQRSVKRGFQVPQRYQQENNNNQVAESRPNHLKPTRVPAVPKRVIFSKEGNVNKATAIKRSRVAPALDIYVSSPPDFPDDV